MKKPAVFLSGALLLTSALYAGDFLLTDNERPGWKSNTFPAEEPRIKTGATLSLITEGEFGCSPEFIKTAAAPNGTHRALLDGRRGPEGDCQGFGSWQPKGRYESFVVDLKQPYNLTRAAVWAQFKRRQKTGEVEILTGMDGRNFTPAIRGAFPDGLSSEESQRGIPLELKFEKTIQARFVLFRVKIGDGAPQQVISEIAVWGNQSAPQENGSESAAPATGEDSITQHLRSI